MNRREFITLLGGGAASSASWPLAAQPQPETMPVIGFLQTGPSETTTSLRAAFLRGLKQAGYVEDQNVQITYRYAGGQYDPLPTLAADLARLQVAIIVASAPPAALAAKAATSTIPIVFMSGTDPVKLGLVSSLNRPGGNITGATFFSTGLEPKWLQLLNEMVPGASTLAVLVNPSFSEVEAQLKAVSTAAGVLGKKVVILKADRESGIDAAFTVLAQQKLQALLVASDPFFFSRRAQLVALASRHAIPTIYQLREFTEAGGLMSYGTSITDASRQAGIYAGQILKGAKPGDLPVLQPTKFELVINLKTAKALGLTVPPTLLVAADEVIE
jgi:putative ABC transport system substrate-binding protein